MDIVVCIKQVPGASAVEIDEETGVLRRSGVDSKINPYDLHALEAALGLKDRYGATVRVITMGPPQAVDIIREAFMMGVDDGAMLSDRRFAGADVLATAHTLAQGIRRLPSPDLIVCGKQTTDGDTAQVGPETANFLGLPHAANIRAITGLDREFISVEAEMDSTVNLLKIRLPCLITVDPSIGQPRLPSFRLKLATRDREVRMLCLEDLEDTDERRYGLLGSPTQVIRIFPPQRASGQEVWQGDGEGLAARLACKLAELKFL